jgi:hypothetical protein
MIGMIQSEAAVFAEVLRIKNSPDAQTDIERETGICATADNQVVAGWGPVKSGRVGSCSSWQNL